MGKYPKGASLGTCDHLDIWPEWWGDMTWPKKHNLPAHLPTYLPTCLPPIENTIRSDPRDLWLLRYLIRVLRTHDLTQKNLPTYLPTYLHNYSPTYLPCDTRQSSRLVTIETQITILTIENLNSWQSFLPDNQEWQWTAFPILAMSWLIFERRFIQSASCLLQELVSIYSFWRIAWKQVSRWFISLKVFRHFCEMLIIVLPIIRRVNYKVCVRSFCFR
jgi:hypothetical protein